MFCGHCGRDIKDANYCPSCGTPSKHSTPPPPSDFANSLVKWIHKIGHESLAKWISVWSTVLAFLIRLLCNETISVNMLTHYAHYDVLSSGGKVIAYLLIALQAVITPLLWRDAQKNKRAFETKDLVIIGILVAVQFLFTLIKLPS